LETIFSDYHLTLGIFAAGAVLLIALHATSLPNLLERGLTKMLL
jgi:hypothetical protein